MTKWILYLLCLLSWQITEGSVSTTTNNHINTWMKHFKSIDESSQNWMSSISACESRMRLDCSILQGKGGREGKTGKAGKTRKAGRAEKVGKRGKPDKPSKQAKQGQEKRRKYRRTS